MVSPGKRPKLLVIVGPTASGKSDLALKLAKKFDGEIIAADSRTTYKGMDTGTAKPSKKEQSKVPHWGIDLVEPGNRFTAYEFKQYALKKIDEIKKRDHLPILVGGTGLYVDSVVFDYSFKAGAKRDPANPRHRMRDSYSKNLNITPDTLVVGLNPADEELRDRISLRAKRIFKAGVVKEADALLKKYGRPGLLKTAGIVYRICLELLDGATESEEAIKKFSTADWQYARRQRMWFKRNKHVNWFSDNKAAEEFIAGILSK